MSGVNPNYDLLPEGLREGMKLYIEHGIEPGSFLRAVLEDKLVESFACADLENRARMFEIASFLYNECPVEIRGSARNVRVWIATQREKRKGKAIHAL